MTGLEALCTALSDLEVRHVFGLPGTQNAEFFNVLPEYGIRPVLATHELSASFLANGYARASGRPGVLATIPGPGFTFALPGLAEARLDSAPIIHLVGTPAVGRAGRGHQAIDQAGMAKPIVKGVIEVCTPDQVGDRLRQAYRLALGGEPGPVLVHLHRDALAGRLMRCPSRVPWKADRESVADRGWAGELRRLVAESRRPVLFVGGGALSSAAGVVRLAERLSAPTLTTLTARGVLAEDHPCAIPFDVERGGLEEVNGLLDRSDLVLSLGCKFSHNGTAGFGLCLPRDRLVQVNADTTACSTTYPARLEVPARVEDVLQVLLDGAAPGSRTRWTRAELANIRGRIGVPRTSRLPEPRFQDIPGGTAEAFFAVLRRALPRDAIVVTDSGLHQVMTRRYYRVLDSHGLVTPADFQSMGFGVPAAIGAALAVPSRPVVAVVGDGGFLMSAMDLLCAVRERVPVVVIVFNDGYLNLIRLQQVRDDGRSTAVGLGTPDLERLAAAMSVRYGRLDESAESTLRKALRSRSAILLEVRLGDSLGIRARQALGLARRTARRTLGQTLLARLKGLGKGPRGR